MILTKGRSIDKFFVPLDGYSTKCTRYRLSSIRVAKWDFQHLIFLRRWTTYQGKVNVKKIAWTFEVLGLWRFLDEEPQTSKTFLKKSPEYPSPTTLCFRFHAYIFRHASVSSTYPGTSVRLSVVRKWFFPISIQSASLQRWKAMDLRFNLAPSFRDLKHPTSRQNFYDTLEQTPMVDLRNLSRESLQGTHQARDCAKPK